MKKWVIFLLIALPRLVFAQEKEILNTYTKKELQADFDLMVNAIIEGHGGLYWYNSYEAFDSICSVERNKIIEGMDSYDFFRIASKIVTSTKEGHCRIYSSRDIGEYFRKKAKLIPVVVKVIDSELYLLNNIKEHSTKGKILRKVDGVEIQAHVDKILEYSRKASDGLIRTGKIRYSIDYANFTNYYADYVGQRDIYRLELFDPNTKELETLEVNGVNALDFREIRKQVEIPYFDSPIELILNHEHQTARLALNSFRHTYYHRDGNEDLAFKSFKMKIDSAFEAIKRNKIENVIIDLRHNSGGTEGYEDYVFSYLTAESYEKYQCVQAKALTFSFLSYTQYNTYEKQKEFEGYMENEFQLHSDGRYLRKPEFMPVEDPREDCFKGKIYVLTSGRTYSGGSELASLLKIHTDAIFVGEETGGGFYGQTSGMGLNLRLPNTNIGIDIPLIKFVLTDFHHDIPFGRGVIPDYQVENTYEEFIGKVDVEMNFVMNLISKRKRL
ncbi:S41 family peptidase [Aureibacter tunicatorum]|uniref:C-terminal processing protease CtpA/Prc n=1 Tax=Aureibacter tunicatorum TaxID=866807 RepID=A0AAE4BSR7_9BACT|nr:S41 family peptidase [Aureibacter tunicatorum]MDR6240056.1 C-terminal processing protease CtpA/Prc [Aureibacter tunicatorum]BDD04528.1 peptidase S41 [Aureibacter tunicatorum]